MRLWQDLKSKIDVIDPQLRSTLDALQDHVADIVRTYRDQELASLTGYDYLVKAFHALSF